MTLNEKLQKVDYLSRYSRTMYEVAPTGRGDYEFLTSSPYDRQSKQVDRIQNCLAVCLINHSQDRSQLLHVSPCPGMVRTGYTSSINNMTYFADQISLVTKEFRESNGIKSAIALGGVDTKERLSIELGSAKTTRHDIYELTLSEVRRALPQVEIEVGPSNKSNSYMFWVGLIALQNDFQIQYINTLAINHIAPDDF